MAETTKQIQAKQQHSNYKHKLQQLQAAAQKSSAALKMVPMQEFVSQQLTAMVGMLNLLFHHWKGGNANLI